MNNYSQEQVDFIANVMFFGGLIVGVIITPIILWLGKKINQIQQTIGANDGE